MSNSIYLLKYVSENFGFETEIPKLIDTAIPNVGSILLDHASCSKCQKKS